MMLLRHAMLVPAFLLALSGCDQQKSATSPDIFVQSARLYAEQNQFRAAMIEVQNALQIDPANEEATIVLANIYRELGQNRRSITILEVIDGQSREYYEALVEAYNQRRKFGSALSILQQKKALMSQDMARYQLLQADAFTGLGEIERARQLVDSVRDKDPTSIPANLGLARLLVIRGDLEPAENLLMELLSKYPENLDVLVLLGVTYIRQGELSLAESKLTEAISVLPSSDLFTIERARILRTLIALLARQGRSGEALIYQRMLVEAFPLAEEISQQLESAVTSIQNGEVNEAEKLLEDLLETAPGDELTGSLLGIIKYIRGDYEAADNYFDSSVDAEIAPSYVLKYMATNLYQMGQLAKVVKTLEGTIEETQDPHLLVVYGISALNSDREQSGVRALKRAIALDPANVRLSLVLAQYFMQKEPQDNDRALAELASAISVNPESVETQTAYLNQLMRMELMSEAETFVADVLNQSPGEYVPLLLAGSLALRQKIWDKAENYFSKAIAQDGKAKDGHFGLAEVHSKMGKWDDAIADYRQIIGLDSSDIRGYRGLLKVYVAKKDGDEGIEVLGRMADTGEENAAIAVSEYLASLEKFAEAQEYVDKIEGSSRESLQTKRLVAQIGYRRARTALLEGNVDLARESIFSALTAFPQNIRLLTLLAQTEIAAEQYSEAEKVIAEIRTTFPEALEPDTLSGDIAFAKANYLAAIEDYKIAWRRMASDVTAAKLFQTYTTSGAVKDAEAFTYEWEAKLPLSVLAIVNRAELQSESEQAISIYEEWAQRSEPSPVVLNNLAWLYLENDRPEKGLEVAIEAWKLDPQNGAIADTYGWILAKLGRYSEAEGMLRTARRLAPSSEEIKDHLVHVQKLNAE